jgi:type III secretion protein V
MVSPAGTSPWTAGLAGLLRALPGLLPTVLVLALLACVLVPLPTVLVDLLLSLSLATAVLLLVAALLVRRTTDFLAFPTLLLLLTLYRLALNVSTTRLILSQADAGRVIDAFASVVVRGDLLVGGVMFAIITVVQYVVIARGAERVAEVGARFALDGLPGHQAAIDADLRAKVISPREAAQRRALLGERSSFYGAMDGAMRFVKGDAIVGLAITAVNLVGGIAIGRWRHGLDIGEALATYGRLTIGDGLLAQIPALLVSLAAGVLVARVDRQSTAPRFAGWLDPPMLVVPAAFLLMMAIVPGMPRLAFVVTAIALGTAAVLLTARREQLRPTARQQTGDRLSVRVGALDDEAERGLTRALAEVRARCAANLRVEVPELELVVDRSVPRDRFEVGIGERRLLRTTLPSGAGRDDAAVLATFRAIMDNAHLLVDLERIDRAVDEVREQRPALVERALGRVDVVELLVIVRALLRERIPCPAMPELLAAVAEHPLPTAPSDRARLVELVRERLAPLWLPPLFDALHRGGAPRWLRFDAELEQALIERAITGTLGTKLGLGHAERARWIERVTTPSSAASDDAPRPLALLATVQARPLLAELLAGATPHVVVLSLAELDAAGIGRPHDVEWLAPS